MIFKRFLFSKIFSIVAVSAVLSLNATAQHAETPIANSQHDTLKTTEHSAEHATASAHHAEVEEAFDPAKMIMEHIADEHGWHLWGHTTLALPVILKTDKGFECFSSAKFDHGHAIVNGNYDYKLVENHIKVVNADGVENEELSSKVLDFSITKNVFSLLISVVIILSLFLTVAAAYRKRGIAAPKGLASFIEPIIIYIRDTVVKPNLGKHTNRFLPYLLTVFFFIWINNLLGLVPFFPGGANLTGNIAVTLVLAVFTFVIVTINGKKTYWAHVFKPHVPWWLYPLMVPIEIVGLLTKPVALTLRLFANITAGHILILSLVSLIFIFKNAFVGTVAVPFVVFISMIELLVAFLQAFIFTMLTSLFLGMALAEPHHEEAHH